ncbi:MAG: immunoglobulin domain-containing protein [Verrucomicrobiales bacterium]|nr:immunoglobulin domain-containing protein [Verrucomicrobiales bacterium]
MKTGGRFIVGLCVLVSVAIPWLAQALPLGPLAAWTTMDFKGNNVTVDSFNSSDPAASLWQTNRFYQGTNYGIYTSAKRQANAVVGTDGLIINVGYANIYGYVDTGPGGTANINANGTVGDIAWIDGGNFGIQTSPIIHARDDMNVNFPNATLPNPTNGWITLPLIISGTNIGGTTYYYYITNNPAKRDLNSMTYYVISNQLTKSIYFGATNAILYLPSGLKFSSGANVLTGSTNSDITIYAAAGIDTGLGIFNNVSQYAPALKLYGLSACTSINLGRNTVWSGYLYAPSASVNFNGGGTPSVPQDVIGSLICHDVRVNGHYNFHFDEALASYEPVSFYPQPKSQAAPVGSDVTFSASIGGGLPLDYRWLFDQTNLPASYDNQAGSVSLLLTNVQLTDAGNYSVVVTNLFNAVTSAPALLFVYTNINQLVPQLGSGAGITNGQFQLTIAGVDGLSYAIQSSTNLTDWTAIATNTSPFNFLDTNADVFPQRFFRSIYLP